MKIVIVGTGYVGLVTGACLAKLGHQVVCMDRDADKVSAIRQAKAPFFEPGLDDLLSEVVAEKRLSASQDVGAALKGAAASFIAVGTPSENGAIDLGQVLSAGAEIGRSLPTLSHHHTVVLKSTCVPGTTEEALRPVLETNSGLRACEDFGLCMNPEFLREGCAVQDFLDADRVVMGVLDPRSKETMEKIYAPLDCPKIVTTPRNAEMIKYTSNALLATLISFSNEISQMCERLPGLDEETVMQGLHLDRRLSPLSGRERVSPGILSYLRAGIGYGGSCFPKDTLALRAFAQDLGLDPVILDSVIATNDKRPQDIVDLIERAEMPLRDKTVAVLGLAFKPGTDDIRESPGIRIAHECRKRGALVRSWDPLAAANAAESLGSESQVFTDIEEALEGAHIAVVTTAWPELREIDWSRAAELMATPVIFDGRSVLRDVAIPQAFRYLTVGRLSA